MQSHGIDKKKNGGDRIQRWDVESLIRRFVNEIGLENYLLARRIELSPAMKELRRRGKDALPAIIEYLSSNFPDEGTDLRVAWWTLLCWIKSDIDPSSDSLELNDTESWFKWVAKSTR